MKKFVILSISSLLICACACNSGTTNEKESLESIKEKHQESLMNWNHRKVRDQDRMIKRYAERRSWEMTRTETGLYYHIYENSEGMPADSGHIAEINYSTYLLNGDFCYSSDSTGSKQIKLGKARGEVGLEETILQMKIGEKARAIVPPHLAFGLPGDGHNIPPDAILVYNIELKNLY